MDRDAFLARVREAALAGRAHSVAIKPFPADTGYVGLQPDDDICQKLAAEIREVGGEAVVVSSWELARLQLQSWLQAAGAKSAYCWQHAVLAHLGISEFLRSTGIQQIDHDSLLPLAAAERQLLILACDVGITSTVLAIAETGTLWLQSQPGQERLASLAPPRHIAIVQQNQIVPDLIDAFIWLHSQGFDQLPSNITLVTGPSKTGDIELQLTTGVHGPGVWQVIIVEAPLAE